MITTLEGPSAAQHSTIVAKVQHVVCEDQCWPIQNFANEVGICYRTCQWIVTHELGMQSCCYKIFCQGSSLLRTRNSMWQFIGSFIRPYLIIQSPYSGSSLVKRARFTVMTWRQSNNPPSRRAQAYQDQKRHDKGRTKLRACALFSLMPRRLDTKNSSQNHTVNSTFYCGLLWWLYENMAQILRTRDLAVVSWQYVVSHFLVPQDASEQNQHEYCPPSTLLTWFDTIWFCSFLQTENEV